MTMTLSEMLKFADDATQGVELKDGDFAPVPPGTYSVAVTEAEVCESKNVNPVNSSEHGHHIKMKLVITEGKHAKRILFFRNNIDVYPKTIGHDDQLKAQKAMAMAAKERKIILESLGKTGIENAAELVGATFKAEVKHETYNGDILTKVSKIMPSDSPARASAAPAPAAAVSAPKAKLPWEV